MTNIHHVEEQCDLWVVDDISCEIDDIFKNSNCIKDTTTYEQDLSEIMTHRKTSQNSMGFQT